MKLYQSAIIAIEYYLPENALTNEMLAKTFPEWSIEKIYAKTGIKQRYISKESECASDMAVSAAKKLFSKGVCQPSDIDFILLCTQSPDYHLPTTACLVQAQLNIPTRAGALDFNLGCSGYIYGLSLAHGLIASGQAKNILLLTTETYSKYIAADDRINRTIFGDGASATLISVIESDSAYIGPFILGSDGQGAEHLIVREGGARTRTLEQSFNTKLHMNGPEIFAFTLRMVPDMLNELYKKANINLDDVDFFVFHQANAYMLECLRKKMLIPKEKMLFFIENCGNTVSSTIPIVLSENLHSGVIRSGMRIILLGFGVGYSWGAAYIQIK